MQDRLMSSTEAQQIVKNIINHRPVALSSDYYTGHRRAAILVGIFVCPDDNQIHVLLTKRTSRLRSHAGEIACPGGRWEHGDESLVNTALRETHEEIGLEPAEVKVLKELHPSVSRNILLVAPVVALIPPDIIHRCKLNPLEVDLVFSVPLKSFLKAQGHQHEDYSFIYDDHGKQIEEIKRSHSFIRGKDNHRVFGLTGNIILKVAQIAYEGIEECEFEPYAPGQLEEHLSQRYRRFAAMADKVDHERLTIEKQYAERNEEFNVTSTLLGPEEQADVDATKERAAAVEVSENKL
ncbi:hypothetical protein SeMB42_g02179 [Synchytrium endobioticum]|uniref:Nudix hydrolase domain-containing protein n=1 Tax=Synchytrium endobioticum TaxID=286115 RepID=A0A507DIC6_9FUNG|nr:hypothetical protein SeLEV6574_g02838 [Synchytrium endobioticum]TPX50648.1 hypothetical protein SeMB42_g02179 [Synchytrium endobioticum]